MANTLNEQILASLPKGVARVGVLDENGQRKWRDIDAVRDTDTITMKTDGTPSVMGATPGRKPKAKREPANEMAAKIMEDKQESMEQDPLVRAIQQNPESPDVLQHVMVGISQEAASLKFEREEAERKGEATSQISMRRVNALKAAGDAFLKRVDQLHNAGVDLDSPAFTTVMEFMGETIHTTLVRDCHMRSEEAQAIMTKLAGVLGSGEWRAELEAKLRR